MLVSTWLTRLDERSLTPAVNTRRLPCAISASVSPAQSERQTPVPCMRPALPQGRGGREGQEKVKPSAAAVGREALEREDRESRPTSLAPLDAAGWSPGVHAHERDDSTPARNLPLGNEVEERGEDRRGQERRRGRVAIQKRDAGWGGQVQQQSRDVERGSQVGCCEAAFDGWRS